MTTQVKQSNDFLGTNNDFTLSGSYPEVTIGVNVAFTAQPTDTQFTPDPLNNPHFINGATGVKVKVTNTCNNNAVSGASVAISIGQNPPATASPFFAGILSGTTPRSTDSNGVASFTDLSIDKSSSGYTLLASVSGAGVPVESDPFDITTTSVNCGAGTCTATATSPTSATSSIKLDISGGTGGVLSLTYESHPLVCGDVTNAVGGTVTIDPPQGATLPVKATFVDTISYPVQGPYPVCKNVEVNGVQTQPPHLVPFCSDVPNNKGLDHYSTDPTATVPCITTQTVQLQDDPPTLHTVMLMTTTDPKSYH